MKFKSKPLNTVTAADFNKHCEIIVTKDFLTYKVGQKLCLKNTVILVDDIKQPFILSEEQIKQVKSWRNAVPPKSFRWIAKKFGVSHTTIEKAAKK